jgi:hypothetical protein
LGLKKESAGSAPEVNVGDSPWWLYCCLGAGIIGLAACVEAAMGRMGFSQSGKIQLWVGDVTSSELSQQIADWYSFSHILHGFILYGLIRWISGGRWALARCVVLAIAAESAWEILENTPFVIARYRAATASFGYTGDSILNSVCDILFCTAGFFLARYFPVWLTILCVLVIEVGLLLAIHDNLALNILMLIHPIGAVKRWQMGSLAGPWSSMA